MVGRCGHAKMADIATLQNTQPIFLQVVKASMSNSGSQSILPPILLFFNHFFAGEQRDYKDMDEKEEKE